MLYYIMLYYIILYYLSLLKKTLNTLCVCVGEILVNTTRPPICIPEDKCQPICYINGKEYEQGEEIKDPSVCDLCERW